MKFQLVINMERMTPDEDMQAVERHVLEMVQMADAGRLRIRMGGGTSRVGNDYRAKPVSAFNLVGRTHGSHPFRHCRGRRSLLASD